MSDPQEWTTGGDGICRMKWVRVECADVLLEKPGAKKIGE